MDLWVIRDSDDTEIDRIHATPGVYTTEGRIVSVEAASAILEEFDHESLKFKEHKANGNSHLTAYYSEALYCGFLTFEIDHQHEMERAVERNFNFGFELGSVIQTESDTEDLKKFVERRSAESDPFKVGFKLGYKYHKERETALDILYTQIAMQRFGLCCKTDFKKKD